MAPADAALIRLLRVSLGAVLTAPVGPDELVAGLVAAGLVEINTATGLPGLTAAGRSRAIALAGRGGTAGHSPSASVCPVRT